MSIDRMSRHLASRSLAVPVIALLALAACKKAAEPVAGSGADASVPAAASSSPQSAGQRARQKLAAPVAVKEVEPNDDWKRAQTIPARAAVLGELNPRKGKTDDDWFKVAVPAGEKLALQIDLAGVGGAELDATLEVLDRDRNRLARVKSSSGEALALRWVSCVELCFVHVAGRAGAYTLTVAGEPPLEDWELEPNDRAVDATPLLAGASIQGFYGAPADQELIGQP